MQTTQTDFMLADRIWVAVALLHQALPLREDFSREEIREKLRQTGLMEGLKPGSVAAHLKEHLVANVPPSTGKYRMLYETAPGRNLRLFRPGDFTYATRFQKRKPSKSVPRLDEIPTEYRTLLNWYEQWCRDHSEPATVRYEDDPLIKLIGSGKHIWADEHADEYVNNLRREDV